jgi:hypothetical protein
MGAEELNMRSRSSLKAIGMLLGCSVFAWAPMAQAQLAPAPNPGCTETVSYDNATTVTITLTITEAGFKAPGLTFDSPVPSPVTVDTVTCTAGAGAACGTMNHTANDASGTLTTLNTGSTATITISGTVPSNPANAPYSNTTTLTCSNASGCNAGAGDITATCTNSTTLPVKLQSFDVT